VTGSQQCQVPRPLLQWVTRRRVRKAGERSANPKVPISALEGTFSEGREPAAHPCRPALCSSVTTQEYSVSQPLPVSL